MNSLSILEFHLAAGCDETIGNQTVDRFAALKAETEAKAIQAEASLEQARGLVEEQKSGPRPTQYQAPATSPRPPAGDAAIKSAVEAASSAKTVDDLKEALKGFDACPLKKSATNLVFADGNPKARIMFVGEAPGAEEDRQGVPFVGQSGKLLDDMLASIGFDRTSVYISNTVFWRPPGNRTPTTTELGICAPFIERLIELVDPEYLVALGGAAAKSLLAQTESVGRLRGRWFDYSTPGLSHPIPATALFHPAYLLRTPAQKRTAWKDLIQIKKKLQETAK